MLALLLKNDPNFNRRCTPLERNAPPMAHLHPSSIVVQAYGFIVQAFLGFEGSF